MFQALHAACTMLGSFQLSFAFVAHLVLVCQRKKNDNQQVWLIIAETSTVLLLFHI